MKNFAKKLTILLILFLHFSAFSESFKILEGTDTKISTWTLENSLQLYVITEKQTPLINFTFTVHAGISSQEIWDQGYFTIFADLLTDKLNELTDSQFTSECNADLAKFTATVSKNELSEFLQIFFEVLSNPVFTNEKIHQKLEEQKDFINTYSDSVYSYINSSIDSRVFSKYPWKHDSGIYPSLFLNRNEEESRTILNYISTKFYTPQNSAIFICGNISDENALKLIKKYSAQWNGKPAKKEYLHKEDFSTKNKKYLILSDDFSKEITQVVMQYMNFSITENLLLSYMLNSTLVKEKFKNNETIKLRSGEYINFENAHKNGTSRLILQTLLENKESSWALQIDELQKIAESKSNFSRMNFISAQQKNKNSFLLSNSTPIKLIDNLCNFWGFYELIYDEPFIESWNKFSNAAYEINEKDLYEKFCNSNPFIFVLLNTEEYEQCKNDFTEFELITKENGSWYNNSLAAAKAKNESEKIISKSEDDFEFTLNSKDDFYSNEKLKIITGTLSNGIPYALKKNSDCSHAFISVGISGGEETCSKENKCGRTLLINALAKSISLPNVKAWTENTISYVTIECSKEMVQNSLEAVLNALLYGQITPQEADYLITGIEYNFIGQSLETQLKNNAMEYLYRNSPLKTYYDDETKIMAKRNYSQIISKYTELLDASLYSIIITGNFDEKNISSYLENSFGLLKNQKERKEFKTPQPQFKNKERHVQLQHTFTTDLPAELAPKESPLLIPTKDFSDPALLIIKAPENPMQKELFNALMIYISSKMKASIQTADEQNNFSIITKEKVHSKNEFNMLYIREWEKLKKDLEEENEITLNKIKSLWQKKIMGKTLSLDGTAHGLHQGLIQNNPLIYAESYDFLINASSKDFLELLDSYTAFEKAFKIYSVDTKK